MLSLKIRASDWDQTLVENARGAAFGESRVEAFASRFIGFEASDTPKGRGFWVGEDVDPGSAHAGEASHVDGYRTFRDYEGLKVWLDAGKGAGRIRVARTNAGGCPIYVAALPEGVLALSWRFEEVALVIPRRRPNMDACRNYLTRGARAVREQIIEGMFMLWPGESLDFEDGRLAFREVEDPQIVLSSPLREDARATDAFVDTVAQVLERTLSRAQSPLLEVSGGYDSTCVALAAASVRSDLNSYGVIHRGAIGAQQKKRREEIVSLLNLRDHTRPSYTPPPFASLAEEECSFTAYDDIYRLPCAYAVDEHPAGPVDLVITGIGGDELSKEHTFHREEWEVRGYTSSSAADAAAGRADMFMRRGIWLSQPLVNLHVVDFCRALPKKMRAGRQLNILTLARAGLSDGFLFPRYTEHYGNVILEEASLLDFDALFTESVLADYGVTEISFPLAKAREATANGLPLELIVELWLLAKLEVVLRRYLG